MSLILEALRKSEAERRRGVTPDVAMELPPPPLRAARSLPGWMWPLLVIGLLAVVTGLWLSRRPPPAPSAPTVTTPASSDASATPSPAAPAIVPRPVRQRSPSPVLQPMPAPIVEAPPANPTPLPAPVAAAPVPAPLPPGDVVDSRTRPMPAVKLSMHMWDESPARRFVILNGQRMAEGDRSGDLQLIAIERDGVVVERNGQRARVPLP